MSYDSIDDLHQHPALPDTPIAGRSFAIRDQSHLPTPHWLAAYACDTNPALVTTSVAAQHPAAKESGPAALFYHRKR